jgi:hypothetical protein
MFLLISDIFNLILYGIGCRFWELYNENLFLIVSFSHLASLSFSLI